MLKKFMDKFSPTGLLGGRNNAIEAPLITKYDKRMRCLEALLIVFYQLLYNLRPNSIPLIQQWTRNVIHNE